MKRIIRKCLLMLVLVGMIAGMPLRAAAAEGSAEISVRAVSSSKIQINWTMTDGASAYRIYRSTSAEGGFAEKGTISAQTLSYQDSGVQSGITYYYRVVPVDAAGQEVTAQTRTVHTKAPQKTAISRVEVRSTSSIRITWKKSRGANGYQIFRAAGKTGEYQLLDQLQGSGKLNYTDERVTPGKNYYYKVRPVTSSGGTQGTGSYSSAALGRTIAKAQFRSITSVNSQTIRIGWKKVTGAKSFQIYRSTTKKGGYRKIATVSGGTRKYTDKTVKGGRKYYYKLLSVGELNGKKITSGYTEPVSLRALAQVRITSVGATQDDALKVKWKKVAGATKYKIYRSASQGGKYKKVATVEATAKELQYYTDRKITSGVHYYYKVQAFSSDEGIIEAGSGTISDEKDASTQYSIMGETTVTVDQMMALYESSGRSFPSNIYKDRGAKNLKKFCQIVMKESEAEGIRAEVIFAQICLETGYLQFGGQVRAEQCNFAGLGATDDGAAGASFPNVSIGIRAQVQHLKGYASTEGLNQACVDPRFVYLSSRRGTARYVQSLGGGNWATDPNYASKLMNLIKTMKSF